MAVPVVEGNQLTTSGAAATSLAVSQASGVTAGETVLVILAADLTNALSDEFNTPTGWDKILGHAPGGAIDAAVVAYWRIATGDSNDDITVTWTTAAEAVAWYIRVSGAHASAPLDVTGTGVSTSSTSHAITGVTTTVDECLAFYCLGFDGGDGYTFSVSGTGWSESQEAQYDTGGATVSGCWGTKEQASAGGTGTATVTSSVSDGAASFQFAIAPAAASNTSIVIPTGPWR